MGAGIQRLVAVAAVTWMCACSSAKSTTPGSGASGSSSSGGSTASDAGTVSGVEGCAGGQTTVHNYPAGPYGIDVGQTLADVCLSGYASPTQETLVPMALHDFFDPSGTSNHKLLFLSAGMTWCGPCNREASELSSVQVPGVAMFQVLLDGPTYGVGSTEADLKAWDELYKLPFWVAMDPNRTTADD
jgi:hypothetical protein